MAEVVYRNLEQILPELQELEKQEVFTKEELRIATKRRTDFEYKLQKKVMKKQDALNYIEYEMKFEKLMSKRMKRLKLHPFSPATINLQRRIHSLFDKVLMKFGDDLNIWTQYINFCKRAKAKKSLAKVFAKLLQKHPHNPDVWFLAAKYEIEDQKNVGNARSILQKGLRQNNESSILWLEYFKMELLHVRKIKKRKEALGIGGIDLKETEEGEPKEIEIFLQNKTAEIVYKNGIKKIPGDFKFRMQFLEICLEFDDTENLITNILTNTEDDFKTTENIFEIILKKNILQDNKKIVADDVWLERESNILQTSREILTQHKSNCTMWESFLNILGELLKLSATSTQTNRRVKYIEELMSDASAHGVLSCSMACFWLDLVVDVEENPLSTIEKYVDIFPHEPQIALKFLAAKAEVTDDWEDLKKLFQRTLKTFKKGDLAIWQLYLDLAAMMDFDQCQNVFEEACFSSRKDVRYQFASKYLIWLYESKGVDDTRQLYQRLFTERMPIEFLQNCVQVESIQEKIDLKRLRHLHEKLVDYHGTENPDLWIEYIRCEKKHNGTDIESASRLFMRAKNSLKGNLNEEFLVKHAELLRETRRS